MDSAAYDAASYSTRKKPVLLLFSFTYAVDAGTLNVSGVD